MDGPFGSIDEIKALLDADLGDAALSRMLRRKSVINGWVA